MLILIPAYEPDLRLVQLVRDLRSAAPEASLLIVDDGSGAAFSGVFGVAADAGATVLTMPTNRGKGATLKRGFAWASEHLPGEPVVCADCDGQHAPRDILRVADAIAPATMVLGGRRFTGHVQTRSRVGNAVRRLVFRALTGTPLHDTQTGLRGYPAALLTWLAGVEGDRFEYESNLLLQARAGGVRVTEIEIETIYLDANASSHFRPVQDSLRIYAPVLGFAASSLASAAVDWFGVLSMMALTGNLFASVVLARLVSGALNFKLNRDLVFADRGDCRAALWRYIALAAALLAANYTLLDLLVGVAGVPLVAAKLVVEGLLFTTSYVVQHRTVFRAPASAGGHVAVGAVTAPDASVGGRTGELNLG
jgi:putative flippase GtrA